MFELTREFEDTRVWATEGDKPMHVECLPAIESMAVPREFYVSDPENERCVACGGMLAWQCDDVRNDEYRKWPGERTATAQMVAMLSAPSNRVVCRNTVRGQ